MANITEVEKDGRIYIKEEYPNGAIVETLKAVTVFTPEYVTLLENEDKVTIKTGVLTPQERDKLLVAIALKLGII